MSGTLRCCLQAGPLSREERRERVGVLMLIMVMIMMMRLPGAEDILGTNRRKR